MFNKVQLTATVKTFKIKKLGMELPVNFIGSNPPYKPKAMLINKDQKRIVLVP